MINGTVDDGCMRVQGQWKFISFDVKTVANRPSVGQQVISVDIGVVLNHIPLSSYQDEIGQVWGKCVVA